MNNVTRLQKHAFLMGVAIFWGISFGGGCATHNPDKKNYSDSEKARMLVEIANGALTEKDITGALLNLKKAEEFDKNVPELYHSRALAYHMKNDLPSALVAARRAVELKPNYSDANNTLGKLLVDSGKSEEGEEYLKVAAEDALYREAYKAMTTLGMIKYRKGELSAAEKFFSRAVQDAPALACVAYYYRGHIFMKKGNLKDAINDYSNATKKFCAGFGDAYLALGMAYQQGKQYALARETYLEIQKRYPDTPLADRAVDQLKYLP